VGQAVSVQERDLQAVVITVDSNCPVRNDLKKITGIAIGIGPRQFLADLMECPLPIIRGVCAFEPLARRQYEHCSPDGLE
jgi:hypothetical protein